MALNAGESEMCVQAKDSSRQFSSSSPTPCVAAAGRESPPLARMKSDRDDEDGGYCNSLSLIVKAVCLVRFNRQHRLFRQCEATSGKCVSQLRKKHAFSHSTGCHCQAHDCGGLGTQVTLLRWIGTSGQAVLRPRHQALPVMFLHLFCTCTL